MKLASLILCEDVIRDINTDNVTLINIIDEINATSLPVYINKCGVYAMLVRESEDSNRVFTGTLKIYNNETVIATHVLDFSIPKNRVRLVSRFTGLALVQEGTFKANLTIDEFINESIVVNIIKKEALIINKKD